MYVRARAYCAATVTIVCTRQSILCCSCNYCWFSQESTIIRVHFTHSWTLQFKLLLFSGYWGKSTSQHHKSTERCFVQFPHFYMVSFFISSVIKVIINFKWKPGNRNVNTNFIPGKNNTRLNAKSSLNVDCDSPINYIFHMYIFKVQLYDLILINNKNCFPCSDELF